MTISEARMAWGSFDIRLLPDTPSRILQTLWRAPFGLVRVYPQRIDEGSVGGVDGLFCGVLHTLKGHTIGGPGQTWFLGQNGDLWGGNWDEVGPYSVTSLDFNGSTNGSLTDWVAAVLSDLGTGLTVGDIGGPSSSTKEGGAFSKRTAKTILDGFISPVFNVEYRVTPNLAVDVGYASELFPETAPVPLAIKRGGRDLQYLGLQTDDMQPELDVAGFLSRGTALEQNTGYVHSVGNTNPYSNPAGDPLNWGHMQRMASERSVTADRHTDADRAAAQLALESTVTTAVTLSATEYTITRRMKPGDFIYVYDLEQGLFDQTHQITFRGETIYPVKLRVEGVDWPVEAGMSVFFDNRHQGGALTEITRYVDFSESGSAASITVGRPPRSLGSTLRHRP